MVVRSTACQGRKCNRAVALKQTHSSTHSENDNEKVGDVSVRVSAREVSEF